MATFIEPPPRLNDTQGIGTGDHHPEPTDESGMQCHHPTNSPVVVDSSKPSIPSPNEDQLSITHETLQLDQQSPLAQDLLLRIPRNEQSHQNPPLHDFNALSFSEQYIAELPRGVPNPIKKTSDDIRRQEIATDTEGLPSNIEQNGLAPLFRDHGQSPYADYPGIPQLPNQTNSISFNPPTELHFHKKSTTEIPRPVQIYPTKTPTSSEPRFVSNPFQYQALQEQNGEGQDRNNAINLSPDDRKILPQEIYHPVDRFRTNERGSIAGNVSVQSTFSTKKHQGRESLAPGLSNQRLDMHRSVSQAFLNPPTDSSLLRGPINQEYQTVHEQVNASGRVSEAYTQVENEAFALQLNNVQGSVGRNHHYNQGDRNRNSLQHTLQNQRNQGPSVHKPYTQEHRNLVFPENCTLYISGLPAEFTAKDVWQMLHPVAGVTWTGDPRRAFGRDFLSTRVT